MTKEGLVNLMAFLFFILAEDFTEEEVKESFMEAYAYRKKRKG